MSDVESHDLAGVVDPLGPGGGRAGHVDRGIAASTQQEAVVSAINITVVISHDLAESLIPVARVSVEPGTSIVV